VNISTQVKKEELDNIIEGKKMLPAEILALKSKEL